MYTKIILLISLMGFGSLLYAQETLTLEKAISLGLKNSYGISISREQSAIAELNDTWGAAGAYPTISGSAQFSFSPELISGADASSSSASLDANWTLFNGFRVKTSKRISEGRYNLAKSSEVVQIENCISDIVLAYYTYAVESKLLDVTETLYKLSKDRYERDVNAAKLGAKSTYELIQSESAYLTDNQNMLNQQRGVQIAINNLNLAMSVEPSKSWMIDRNIEVPTKDYKIETLVELMTSNNSTLKSQYINRLVIQDEIELAKGDILPKLSLTAGGRYNFTSMNKNNSFSPYAGATLSATIFAGGVKKRNLAIAKIQANTVDISIEQITREMTTSLTNQLDSYNYTMDILALSNREVEVSEINLELSLERFKNGSMNSFDYRIVHIEYLNAAINQQQLILSLLSSNVELTRLIGGVVQEYE